MSDTVKAEARFRVKTKIVPADAVPPFLVPADAVPPYFFGATASAGTKKILFGATASAGTKNFFFQCPGNAGMQEIGKFPFIFIDFILWLNWR